MNKLALEYGSIVSVKSIGKSWEGRDINLITIDAADYLKSQRNSLTQIDQKSKSLDEKLSDSGRPAIFWTGAHHARELITI